MKYLNNILFISIVSSLLVACGSKGYPENETKAAQKACSCWADVAEQEMKIKNYKDQFSEEAQDAETKEDMENKKKALEAKAKISCYGGWILEQDNYYMTSDESNAAGTFHKEFVTNLSAFKATCPEIAYQLGKDFYQPSFGNFNPFEQKGKKAPRVSLSSSSSEDWGSEEDYGNWDSPEEDSDWGSSEEDSDWGSSEENSDWGYGDDDAAAVDAVEGDYWGSEDYDW